MNKWEMAAPGICGRSVQAGMQRDSLPLDNIQVLIEAHQVTWFTANAESLERGRHHYLTIPIADFLDVAKRLLQEAEEHARQQTGAPAA